MPARAEPGDEGDAAAQALYASATKLMDEGKYAEAREKLVEVTRLVPEGIGAQITLAQCDEDAGRYATAWSEYLAAEQAAQRKGQVARVERIDAKVDELTPKLSHLTIELPVGVRKLPGLEIARDGVGVEEAQWGDAIPVDAGDHRIDIRAPGKATVTMHVHVAEGAVARVVGPETLFDASSSPGNSGSGPRPRPWQLPLGVATGGTGIVAAAVGLGLGGAALSKVTAADRECSPDLQCSQQGIDLRSSATTLANASTGLIIAGALLTTGGIVLIATAPSAPRQELRAGLGSVELVGRF
jgi:hypothetical protein